MDYSTKNKSDIKYFLEMADAIPVVDVRSPSEFKKGHIPAAINIPLFNDEAREKVGIRYKKAGRLKAILTGLQLTGPELSDKLEKAVKTAVNGQILAYCWRGGMRSETMAWLFSLGGIEVTLLERGYKSYRSHVLDKLSHRIPLIILGGYTGSGKTEILKHIRESGYQSVDLEGLANHKGSAFGALGKPPQPFSEHFANLLFDEVRKMSTDKPLWLEDESRNIGNVFIPGEFYANMQSNPAVVLIMDLKTRLPRLIEEYSSYPEEDLKKGVMKITKRLGSEKAKDAIQAIIRKDYSRAIEITLGYYDKAYLHSLKKRMASKTIFVHTDTDDVAINATKVLDAASGISW